MIQTRFFRCCKLGWSSLQSQHQDYILNLHLHLPPIESMKPIRSHESMTETGDNIKSQQHDAFNQDLQGFEVTGYCFSQVPCAIYLGKLAVIPKPELSSGSFWGKILFPPAPWNRVSNRRYGRYTFAPEIYGIGTPPTPKPCTAEVRTSRSKSMREAFSSLRWAALRGDRIFLLIQYQKPGAPLGCFIAWDVWFTSW